MASRFELVNARFYILLALADGPKCGVEIWDQIVGDTMGSYVRQSTLYAALGALVRDGLAANDGLEYRRTYWLTERGRRMFGLRLKTLAETVELAQGRLKI